MNQYFLLSFLLVTSRIDRVNLRISYPSESEKQGLLRASNAIKLYKDTIIQPLIGQVIKKKKQECFSRHEEMPVEMACNINFPMEMLNMNNLFTIQKENCGNRNYVVQKDVENIIDGIF